MFMMRQTIIVMSRHIEFEQKNDIYTHYQKLDLAFYKTHNTGDLMNRISEDVSRVRMYTGPAIMYFINLAAIICFSIYFMLRSDVKLTIVALCPLPILAITIYLVNKIIHRKSERIQSLLSDLTANAQESYSGIRVIKSFVQENNMFRYFKKNAELYRSNALSLAKTEAIYFPFMGLMIGLSTLLTIMIGGLDVVHGTPGASVGKIAEFVLYIQMLTFPVSAIGWTASMTQRAATSQGRINEFLNQQPAIQNSIKATDKKLTGDIVFEDVNFFYPDTGIHAIKNLSIHLKAGSKIAIIGRTGSGKTTLAQLLVRLYDIENGAIRLDDLSISDIRLEALRSQISYVPQDVFLFSDTIYNNIRFGNEAADDKMIEEAAKMAGIYREIQKFPEGFKTLVGERGVTLSGGQKQRISIARALVKNAPIIIFDDCLSAVDVYTEKQILQQIEKHLVGKTAIFITHRIFSSLQFDSILVLQDGKLAEEGNHTQLVQRQGIYASMYNKQLLAESFTVED